MRKRKHQSQMADSLCNHFAGWRNPT